MSHVAYDLMLSDAMNDLQEQVKVEHVPAEKNEQNQANIETWPDDEIFQHLACLYIKYIDIYRKLETCYDQIVHPQKRIFIKRVLESTICRICEMKKDLILFNPRPKSIYVHLDQLLFDLKYDPSIIEIPVPRYFKEDDKIKVELAFKEKVERDTGKKKKKKKAKKKKKKKSDDDEPKPEPKSMREKEFLLTQIMDAHISGPHYKGSEPIEEIVHDPFTLDMEIVSAICLIQKNERGRQGRLRVQQILQQHIAKILSDETKRKVREGKMPEATHQEKEQIAAEFVQRRIRGILARKQVEEMRQQEMIFLGMQRQPKTAAELANDDPIHDMKQTMEHRKHLQEDHMIVFDNAKTELEDNIETIEGNDIVDNMMKERREWIQEQKAMANGKVPADIAKFYERNNTEQPLSPEEEEAKKAAEEAEKGKKGKKEKKKEKKGKKGKGGDDDGKDQVAKIGPSEVVLKFQGFYADYNLDWANRDETKNHDQSYDRDMAIQAVRPEVEKKKTVIVDQMIRQELQNMMVLAKQKQKKKKKGKKKGKKKSKKKKGPKLPGAKWINGRDPYDLLVELIKHNIVKKLPPQNLKDFIGEFNYIHSMLDDIKQSPYDPSMALIRQLVTEYIIFPLGSALVRQRFPEHVRSFLFYGPTGTGKTQVVRAIAHETKSMVFDLSPASIDGQFNENKAACEKMVAMVMMVAKEYQPALIYIDEAEKIWPAKKKKKKGQKKAKKNDMTNPNRIEKALSKWRSKWITDETRITIVGCTSEPQEGNKKKFKKFFDKAIYFPFPDYTTRRLMWKTFITELGGKLKNDFPMSTLAHISAGYSAGSIKRTCENVLTEFRKNKQEQRPLALPEFIGPLSLCAATMDDQYDDFKKFTDDISGDGKRRKDIEAALNGEDGDSDPKKKNSKTKKKGK